MRRPQPYSRRPGVDEIVEAPPKAFGKMFIILAFVFLLGGLALFALKPLGLQENSTVGEAAAAGDAQILGIFLIVMTVGFGTFGVLALKGKWAGGEDDGHEGNDGSH